MPVLPLDIGRESSYFLSIRYAIRSIIPQYNNVPTPNSQAKINAGMIVSRWLMTAANFQRSSRSMFVQVDLPMMYSFAIVKFLISLILL